MRHGLPPHRRHPLQQVGVEITRQQRRLEEDHGGVPYRRRSAQQRQHQLGRHRLNQENQTGRGEDGDGEGGRCYRVDPAMRRRQDVFGHALLSTWNG